MTVFARYYKNRKLHEFTMNDIENLMKDESNKEKLAEIIYHRYYDRFLKPFYYFSSTKVDYIKEVDGQEVTETKNEFNTEFKSGFAIMTNCCLLIEVLSTYFTGEDEVAWKQGKSSFNAIFKKAGEYNNSLKVFENEKFYDNIRCGLLHQGETYGKFKIRRSGKLYDENNLIINAKLFCDKLKDFLKNYQNELITSKWNSDIWSKCKAKLCYIIENSR